MFKSVVLAAVAALLATPSFANGTHPSAAQDAKAQAGEQKPEAGKAEDKKADTAGKTEEKKADTAEKTEEKKPEEAKK